MNRGKPARLVAGGLARGDGLTDEQVAIADVAHSIGAKYALSRFDDQAASEAQWADLCQVGFPGLSMPEEYGGVGGMFDLCLAMERIAGGGFPAAKMIIGTAVAGSIIARHGTPEQKQRWLPGVASGEVRFCFAMTEPTAGSNAINMTSTARRQDGVWRLRGEKTYISAADVSNAMLVVTQDPEHGGLTLFALALPEPRITMNPISLEVPLFERQFTVFFEDVELTDDAVIGEPGAGGRSLFDGLNPERLVVAAQAVGLGRWCLARATDYARERVVFDVPIGQHQAVQHPLAESLIELEGAALLLWRAARMYDSGAQAGLESNMAKLAGCDAGFRASDRALQTFGGSGYTDESMVFQRFAYLRLLRSIPVARELALNHIATSGLGLPRSY
jgi:alkylation response protein AidB-like acyl-CoA dehydrogenase